MSYYELSREQKADLIKRFKAADQNHDGEVSFEEMAALFKDCLLGKEAVETLMSSFDIDGDKNVSIGELRLSIGYGTYTRQKWRKIFDVLDEDLDGRLTYEEVVEFNENIGMKFSQVKMRNWFKQHDADGDGFIHFLEFLKIIADIVEDREDN